MGTWKHYAHEYSGPFLDPSLTPFTHPAVSLPSLPRTKQCMEWMHAGCWSQPARVAAVVVALALGSVAGYGCQLVTTIPTAVVSAMTMRMSMTSVTTRRVRSSPLTNKGLLPFLPGRFCPLFSRAKSNRRSTAGPGSVGGAVSADIKHAAWPSRLFSPVGFSSPSQ